MWQQSHAISSCNFKGQELKRECTEGVCFLEVFSVWVFHMKEKIYLKLGKKSMRFSNKKGKVVNLQIFYYYYLKKLRLLLIFCLLALFWVYEYSWADSTLGTCSPCDRLLGQNFFLLLTGLSLERYHSHNALGTRAISFELTETPTLLKATTSCESTAE